MSDQKFVFGVDLDGVVADFYEGLRPIAAEWLGVQERCLTRSVTYGLPEWHLERMGADAEDGYHRLHRFAVTQRDLFRNLSPIGHAPATLRRISAMDVRIRIITHRLYIKYFHREALAQTVDWLEHHGIPYWDLCFMKEKSAVGADLYIEDSPRNIASLRDADCDVIVFGNTTNLDVPGPRATNWEQVEQLVVEHHTKWMSNREPSPKRLRKGNGSKTTSRKAS